MRYTHSQAPSVAPYRYVEARAEASRHTGRVMRARGTVPHPWRECGRAWPRRLGPPAGGNATDALMMRALQGPETREELYWHQERERGVHVSNNGCAHDDARGRKREDERSRRCPPCRNSWLRCCSRCPRSRALATTAIAS